MGTSQFNAGSNPGMGQGGGGGGGVSGSPSSHSMLQKPGQASFGLMGQTKTSRLTRTIIEIKGRRKHEFPFIFNANV